MQQMISRLFYNYHLPIEISSAVMRFLLQQIRLRYPRIIRLHVCSIGPQPIESVHQIKVEVQLSRQIPICTGLESWPVSRHEIQRLIKHSFNDRFAVFAQFRVRRGWADPIQEPNQQRQLLYHCRTRDFVLTGMYLTRLCFQQTLAEYPPR